MIVAWVWDECRRADECVSGGEKKYGPAGLFIHDIKRNKRYVAAAAAAAVAGATSTLFNGRGKNEYSRCFDLIFGPFGDCPVCIF